MTNQEAQDVQYCCPGEEYSISRPVHLGRLARFYPRCRQCPHRDDTGTLSARQVERLVETRPRGEPRPLFCSEWAGVVPLDDLDASTARDVAAALGVCLQRRTAPGATSRTDTPVVVIAGDGRPLTCELVAAVSEGLRWAGCRVVDIGQASVACLGFAIDHLRTTGGVLVGSPGKGLQLVGLKFFDAHSRPLSEGGRLDSLKRTYQAGADRPTRAYGSLRRFRAEAPYLAALAEHYHTLRPLRFVLDSTCAPVVGYLMKLVDPTACEIIPSRMAREQIGEQVVADEAHFGARIDGDGERCAVFDEQGRCVSPDRLSPLLARNLPGEIASAALPDALMTVTLLLRLLSRSDRHLSEVLDIEAAIG